MGTDIHIVAQVQDENGKWRDIETAGYDIENRCYTWFTFLDGTREQLTNEVRKEGIIPLSAPRYAPEGFETCEEECGTTHNGTWMGYGIISWATLYEILEHEKIQPVNPRYPGVRVGPIDELERLFAGHDPSKCRIVFGYDS